MSKFKEIHLRPGRKIFDQFVIASVISVIVMFISIIIFPVGKLIEVPFSYIFGGDADVVDFAKEYFDFISIWIGVFLVVLIFRSNRTMLKGVKYYNPFASKNTSSVNGNRPGNNFIGLLIGLALGFGTNGLCILMSVLLGDVKIVFNSFHFVSFIVIFISVFIQSAAEELLDRWYLYQKLRRRYKSPWIAIIVNSFVFMSLHIFNPGITLLSCIQIFVVGFLFSLFIYYYNGLWIAMAFHAGWNFTQSILFGLPNSGIVSAYSVFKLDAAPARNGFFYDVNFGVEGSLGAVLLLIALCILIMVVNRGKKEHTDLWAALDVAAIEKAEAKKAAIKSADSESAEEKTAESESDNEA